MAQMDLGKVKMTDAELSEKIIQINGGVRLGKDADGKPGYVVTDAETGADTVIPFSSGGTGGGFPIEGAISFAGTVIHSLGNAVNQYISAFFEEPVEISGIKEIKTVTDINSWYRISSAYTSNLSRQMYICLYFQDSEGNISQRQHGTAILNVSGTTNGVVADKEIIIPLSEISIYEKLAGIGCRLYQYGGNSNAYWFQSQIGNVNLPGSAKMKYFIS